MKNKKFDILVNFEGCDSITHEEIRVTKGDYNSIEFNFQLSKTDYTTAMFYMIKPNGIHYASKIENNNVVFVKESVFNQAGTYLFSVSLYDSNSKLTNTSRGKIIVIDGDFDADKEIVEQDNYPILDNLIQQCSNLEENFETSLENIKEAFKSVSYNSTTGVLTFIKYNNTTVTIDLPLELIVTDGHYDKTKKSLVLVLANDETIEIPVSELVNEYYGDNSTIELKTVGGKLTFNVKNGVYVPVQAGKGLSSNDFTNTYKQNVDSNTSSRHTHNNKNILDATTASYTEEKDNIIDNLKTVATSGSYNDLSNKPTIPSATTIVDNLTSTSKTGALSANQGKVLNDKITGINNLNFANAGFHNSIFRGKDITSYLNDGSLFTRISSGNFNDLYVGDYIIKNNITWRIAGFDVYYNKGDQGSGLTTHHAIIVPDKHLTTACMNDTNTSAGGYVGSKMYTETLPSVLSTYITPVFGNHVLEYRNVLSNSINATGYNRFGTNNGCSNGWAWYSRKLDLLNEVQVYGSISWSSSGYDIGSDNCQLPLFRLAPQYITNRSYWYWLRSVTTASAFAGVSRNGGSASHSASDVGGVRPCFYID